MKVLVVDDAVPFRTQIKRLVDEMPGVEVVGTASNGKIAIDIVQRQEVDLLILDLNMPVMGGLETIEEMRKLGLEQDVIIFASKTARNAKDTVKALSLGASDFVVKPDGEAANFEAVLEQVKTQLIPRIAQFLPKFLRSHKPTVTSGLENVRQITDAIPIPVSKNNLDSYVPQIIIVASSTGGPRALETFFAGIKEPPKIPILVAQHMPETFTKFLAKRIGEMNGIECREASNGEPVEPGRIYFAPGNFHMKVIKVASGNVITLDQGPRVNSVRPAADLLFQSVSALYGKQTMAFVLTGMGQDGTRGCEVIKKAGGSVMIQDEETSVVWGMPGEVHRLGHYDTIGSIQSCCDVLARMCELRKAA